MIQSECAPRLSLNGGRESYTQLRFSRSRLGAKKLQSHEYLFLFRHFPFQVYKWDLFGGVVRQCKLGHLDISSLLKLLNYRDKSPHENPQSRIREANDLRAQKLNTQNSKKWCLCPRKGSSSQSKEKHQQYCQQRVSHPTTSNGDG